MMELLGKRFDLANAARALTALRASQIRGWAVVTSPCGGVHCCQLWDVPPRAEDVTEIFGRVDPERE